MLSWFKRKALAATEYAEDVEAEIDASTARYGAGSRYC